VAICAGVSDAVDTSDYRHPDEPSAQIDLIGVPWLMMG